MGTDARRQGLRTARTDASQGGWGRWTGQGRRLPDGRAIRHANSPPLTRRRALTGRELARAFARSPGSRPAMPSHHPHTAPAKPTPRQQRYLRQLAEQTGTSFTPPTTKTQASREIQRLQALARDSRSDRVRDQQAVQADLHAGAGDSVRHQPDDTRGHGASARWAHSRETDR